MNYKMNKLYIIAVLLLGYTASMAQITQMIIHETGGNTVTFQLADIDSITYDTTAIATCPATVTDSRDNEVYAVVAIGNQCWMAENLRYDVPGVFGASDTINPTSPSTTYGRLYDWATAMNGASSSSSNPSGVQGICPSGWHLPSDAEWNEMEMALGMAAADTAATGWRGSDHGTKMKSTTGWNSSGNGTNASGFNAFPAGYYGMGSFSSLGVIAYFWSSTETSPTLAWYRSLRNVYTGVFRVSSNKTNGFSCRCVKD